MRGPAKQRQQLVDEHTALVRSIAAKIKEQVPRDIEFDDLFSYGMQGLLEAAERYDGRHGTSFVTFAYYRIRGAMFDGLRSMGWLPRYEYQRLRFEERAAAYLGNLAERDAGAARSAPPAATSLEDELRLLAEALSGVATVFVTTMEGRAEAADVDGSETPTPQLQLEDHERRRAVQDALAALPERERQLLQLYYFDDKPLEEVGRLLGLSKSWTSRLHARAITLLNKELVQKGVTRAQGPPPPRMRARR
jgi:RNA polymerase sigma factor for flagellar operon FliA